MSKKGVFILFLLFAALGLVFSATSVYDSIAHLDREIHSVSCSFIPGAVQDDTGESGCYTVMMSPYSSVLQHVTWGGIPISLASVAVFAFLVFLGIELMVTRDEDLDPRKALFVIAAAAFPLAVSIVYLGISLSFIGELCKTCAGIYVSSLGVFVSSFLSYSAIAKEYQRTGGAKKSSQELPWGYYFRSFFEGVVFVVVIVGVFLAMKPAYAAKDHECGNLLHQQDPDDVMIPVKRVAGGATAIEIVDPLCPACSMFRDRLERSDAAQNLDLSAVLFPLDSDCNWMVSESMHPGACMVAEAILCARENRAEIMNWALDNHEQLRSLAKEDPRSLRKRIAQEYPAVASCVGSMDAKIRVNKSLRWIVSNSSRVMTPQLFVNGVRLCEEDTDLGLEFALTKLLQREPFIPPVKTNEEALERMRDLGPTPVPAAPAVRADGEVVAPSSADAGVGAGSAENTGAGIGGSTGAEIGAGPEGETGAKEAPTMGKQGDAVLEPTEQEAPKPGLGEGENTAAPSENKEKSAKEPTASESPVAPPAAKMNEKSAPAEDLSEGGEEQ